MILATTGEWLLNCLMDFHQDVNFAGVKAGACLASAGTVNPKAGLVLDFLCKSMCYLLTSATRKQSNVCFSLIHSVK